jgi:hypothetical protein
VIGTNIKAFNFYDLYGGLDFQLCACVEMNRPEFRRLNKWNPDHSSNFRRMQYIVSNYMVDIDGRYDLNVGRRLFMVIAFDSGAVESQLALLAYIEKRCRIPLAMCVHSGGKSVHGWFAIWNLLSEYRVTSVHIMAKKLGADKTTHSPGQFVRMPLGFNYKTGRRQKIIWYNRSVLLAQMKELGKDFLPCN